ncbi:MAG: hypothetical protein LBJ14_10285 [Desulfarculales bacterium]|jgi:hypothetical protein|nr:hypothetical protein [Desulfarculales bacterium]
MNKSIETNESGAAADSRAYTALEHSFHDPWADTYVDLNFRFSKPTKTQIRRLSDSAAKNPSQAARDLLLGTIHPEEKDEFLAILEEYPALVMSFSNALVKKVGLAPDLGN